MSLLLAVSLLLAPITDPDLLQRLNAAAGQESGEAKAENPYRKYLRHELVVRFPGSSLGYNRIYESGTKCDAAKAVVDREYMERVARTGKAAKTPEAPTAICIPL